MTSKRNLSDVEIYTDEIFDALSSDFEAISNELHNELQAKIEYKRLKTFGEEQFFDATECNIEMEFQKTRLCFAKINLLALEVHNVIDTIISKKFEDDFHCTLKQKVLKTVLKLYSEQKNDAQEASDNDKDLLLAANSSGKLLNDEERAVFEKLKDLSKYCAENVDNIRKQVIDMPIEVAKPSSMKGKKIDGNIGNINIGNFVSVSSVPTDEPFFDGNVKLCLDEETGEGEKVTLKEECSSVQPKALTQRMRRPNSKYTTGNRVSPLRKISTENSSTFSPASKVGNTLPRTRGRPRKNAT